MRSDLMSRGVSPDDADSGITTAMGEEDVTEGDLLERVAAARASRLVGGDAQVLRRRLFGYLARRGFASSDVRAWIEANWPESEEHRGAS